MAPMLSPLDALAEAYTRLVLAVGVHDPFYVDAFYGPPEWKDSADRERATLAVIRARAAKVLEGLHGLDAAGLEEPSTLRQLYLLTQTASLMARVDMLSGTVFSFDEESRLLYDAVAPIHSAEHFQRIVDELGGLLPGPGTVVERYEAFKVGFVIPRERLDAVFKAATEASRARTKAWIALPAGEDFAIEYVQDKPWSGYNWFKGSGFSLIQVNTDFPIHIDRALDLACHEGYPGHHVYNSLLEEHLVKGRKWLEFSVYALFSPQSLIAEGTANFGIELAFPLQERIRFERDVLFPLAGLDAAEAERYEAVQTAVQKLDYAGNEAARRYLDGAITREEGMQWLMDYALTSPERVGQRMRFIDQNRSYIINYNLGQDLVKQHIEALAADPAARWKAFAELLSTPRVPSHLQGGNTAP